MVQWNLYKGKGCARSDSGGRGLGRSLRVLLLLGEEGNNSKLKGFVFGQHP